MRTAAFLLALRLYAAGAQTPQQLLDAYIATGSDSALSAAQTLIATMPESHGAAVLRTRLLFVQGHHASALNEAKRLNCNMPDDLDTYALLVDAALALGHVDEAERAAQWMLNLRPDDVRSLIRGAAVREALKDYEGAAQMLTDAFGRTARLDVALRAAIGVSLARVNIHSGRTVAAGKLLTQVESLIPGYKPAQALRKQMEKDK